jgi:2-dehydro-3-deoxyphosphogluconate aldolase / (4S)-4-hydroxy-2-oxoglutarate aldolase
VPESMKARHPEESATVDLRQAGRGLVLQRLRATRIVPIVCMPATAQAVWLYDAGFRIFEITMTVPDAVELASGGRHRSRCEDGASWYQRRRPFCGRALGRWQHGGPCREADVLPILGAVWPSEVRTAIAKGADMVKIFPAATVGGLAYIKSLHSVLPQVSFCPTGGAHRVVHRGKEYRGSRGPRCLPDID